MRIVGSRQERPLSFFASAELLKQSALFNESLRSLGAGTGYIPKGVYHFKTAEEADLHAQKCLAEHMARLAARRL